MRFPRFHKRIRPSQVPKQFQVTQIHKPKANLLRLFEILIILAVMGGTIFLFFNHRQVSWQGIVSSFQSLLTPKQATSSSKKEISFEDRLLSDLAKNSFKVKSYSLTQESNYLIVIDQGTKIYFDSKKDSASQVRTLQTLVAKARIEDRQLRRVDFRFEKPVVEY